MKAVAEIVRRDAGEGFRAFVVSRRTHDTFYHYHPEFELTAITRGRGQRLVGTQLAGFSAGDLVLIRPNVPHSYTIAKTVRQPLGAVVIQFLPETLGRDWREQNPFARIRRLLDRPGTGLVFRRDVAERTIPVMERVAASRGLERYVSLLQLLDGLASEPASSVSPGSTPVSKLSRGGDRILRTCTWLAGHFREPVRQEDAARRTSLSPAAFSRLFRKTTGRTFVRFVNELRIEYAATRLMEAPELSIAEIAYDSGYNNLSHFNRQFLALRGESPSSWRAAHQNAHSS